MRHPIRQVVVAVFLITSMITTAAVAGAEPTLYPASIDSDLNTDRIGLVDTSTGLWHLRGENGVVNSIYYGVPGDYPFVGDWDCDGVDTPGLYRQSDGYVYLRNSNTQGVADIKFFFGIAGDVPLAGDFNGDGCDTVSIYRPSEARIYIINKLGSNDGGLGQAEYSYLFGISGDKPFVGDFNGDNIDTVGLHRESTGFVYYRDTNTQGIADHQFFFGIPDDRLVSGDWGIVDGVDTPAVFRPSSQTFYFRHTNTQGVADETLSFGLSPWIPVAGRWTPGVRLIGSLPPGEVGLPYNASVTPAGGVPPYTVLKTSGPAWVSVSTAGVVSGTPTAAGAFTVGMSVTDLLGRTVNQSFPLQVSQPNLGVYGALPAGEIGLPYAAAVTPAGGVPPYTIQKTAGPAWVSVSAAGVVSGTPTAVGAFAVGMSVTDGLGRTSGAAFPLVINASNLGISGALPQGLVGYPYNASVAGTGGVPPYSFIKLSGPGWASVSSTGVVSGTPNAAGASAIGIQVTDFYNRQATGNFPITVVSGCEGRGSVPLIQCQALVELFKDTSGFGWIENTGWLSGSPCDWVGVECDGVNVVGLDLDDNNLDGSLPAEIGDLAFLEYLDLSENFMAGSIPEEIGDLTNLVYMDMHGNEFTGTLPDLSSLTLLEDLDLEYNSLDDWDPDSFGGLTSLTDLDLGHNALDTTISEQINGTNLPNLATLDLEDNFLTGSIPESLTTLSTLVELGLENNGLSGLVPSAIMTMPSLGDLSLYGNGCLTADVPTAAWLDINAPGWNDGC